MKMSASSSKRMSSRRTGSSGISGRERCHVAAGIAPADHRGVDKPRSAEVQRAGRLAKVAARRSGQRRPVRHVARDELFARHRAVGSSLTTRSRSAVLSMWVRPPMGDPAFPRGLPRERQPFPHVMRPVSVPIRMHDDVLRLIGSRHDRKASLHATSRSRRHLQRAPDDRHRFRPVRRDGRGVAAWRCRRGRRSTRSAPQKTIRVATFKRGTASRAALAEALDQPGEQPSRR